MKTVLFVLSLSLTLSLSFTQFISLLLAPDFAAFIVSFGRPFSDRGFRSAIYIYICTRDYSRLATCILFIMLVLAFIVFADMAAVVR